MWREWRTLKLKSKQEQPYSHFLSPLIKVSSYSVYIISRCKLFTVNVPSHMIYCFASFKVPHVRGELLFPKAVKWDSKNSQLISLKKVQNVRGLCTSARYQGGSYCDEDCGDKMGWLGWPQAEREPEFLSLSLDWFQPASSLVFQSEDSNTEHNLKIIPVVKMLQEEASG